MQSQPPPKGSLEELFRHHLLESEAAAVRPRPLVWEHIDNGLLQAQNEKYRRRAAAYRWGMAASLLLATLAGGGWWHSQQVATATLARTNAQREAARRAVTGAVAAGPRTYALAPAAWASATAPAAAARAAGSSAAQVGTAELAAGNATLARAGQANWLQPTEAAATKLPKRSQSKPVASTTAYVAVGALKQPATVARGGTDAMPSTRPATFSSLNATTIAATTTSTTSAPVVASGSLPAVGQPDASTDTTQPAIAFTATAATSSVLLDGGLAEASLATRPTSLVLAATAGPPAELAMKELALLAPKQLRRWRYGAEYAIGAFQPNIDFNRSTSDYNTALGSNTVSLTRAAAAEYRANLRPGLSQRLGLRATRWLGGHWSLSTGLEVAQQEAYSATSSAFTGEQLADLNNFASIPSTGPASNVVSYSRSLRESSFRYRSAGVPLELQYDNQAKPGLSFYGRVGAIVSALLSVRSEVAGNSEATRTYSLTSASTPYRRLTALLRGSAGVRYRPAGRTWGLNVGPTAEAGVQSMNAETDRSFFQQSRPYSVGIEAGIEFGGFKPVQ